MQNYSYNLLLAIHVIYTTVLPGEIELTAPWQNLCFVYPYINEKVVMHKIKLSLW